MPNGEWIANTLALAQRGQLLFAVTTLSSTKEACARVLLQMISTTISLRRSYILVAKLVIGPRVQFLLGDQLRLLCAAHLFGLQLHIAAFLA